MWSISAEYQWISGTDAICKAHPVTAALTAATSVMNTAFTW